MINPARAIYLLELIASILLASRIKKLANARPVILIIITTIIVIDANHMIPIPTMPGSTPLLWMRRPYAMEHPNNVAAWAMLLSVTSPLTPLVIIITQSRGALVGWLTVTLLRYTPPRWIIPAAITAALAFGAAAALRPGTIADRVNIWSAGLRMWTARPLTGWGIGSFAASAYGTNADSVAMRAIGGYPTGGWQPETAHNAIITVLTENGIIGALALLAWIILLGKQIAASQHPAKWSLLAFSIQQIFDDQWLHPITSILLGMTIGLCFGENHDHHISHHSPMAGRKNP